ncbi:MAG: trypsin-like peptidase domain-containing protein [Anaerovoracaceae bacterium]|nr:trypsin-like peptidase domain-containing protein [Bacillota bacterium]MEE0517064.1 trypsin-like peptidase domain-containing protein [Anaerovoracaceae bacterium]
MDDWNKFSGNEEKFSENININGDASYKAPVAKKEKFVTKKVFIITLIAAILFSAIIGAGGFALTQYLWGNSSSKNLNSNNYNLTKATGSDLSMQEIIAKNENSAVAITTESVSTDTWARQYVTEGAGSGIVYSEDGYIITNNHVIEGASTINVTFNDGKSYEASLVAADSQSDIAVLKIDADGLTPVSFNDSDSLSVGDLAVVIGNPLGTLAGTATEGIVSGLEREITIDGKSMTLIQVSASVNPGNSGGGVFDQQGNLIGLVVAKSSGSDVEGLGFAIPSNTVQSVVKSLIENGYVAGRPAAGITIVDLSSVTDAMKYGVKQTGVYIQEVTGKNAKAAGLEAGDLVYMVDGEKVTSSDMLVRTIQKHQVGDKVKLTVVRGDEMKDIELTLEESVQNKTQDN